MARNTQPQPWKRRLEPILDTHVQASLDHAGGQHDDHGHYAELVYAGIADRERANEIKKALFRSARHLGVSLSAKIEKQGDGTYSIRYQAHSKAHAKAYMLERYGADMSKWPYSSRKGFPNYG